MQFSFAFNLLGGSFGMGRSIGGNFSVRTLQLAIANYRELVLSGCFVVSGRWWEVNSKSVCRELFSNTYVVTKSSQEGYYLASSSKALLREKIVLWL